METLEKILKKEKKHRKENGTYGIKKCKEQILFDIEMYERCGLEVPSLYLYLENYVHRANTDKLFNRQMVLACWELINEKY